MQNERKPTKPTDLIFGLFLLSFAMLVAVDDCSFVTVHYFLRKRFVCSFRSLFFSRFSLLILLCYPHCNLFCRLFYIRTFLLVSLKYMLFLFGVFFVFLFCCYYCCQFLIAFVVNGTIRWFKMITIHVQPNRFEKKNHTNQSLKLFRYHDEEKNKNTQSFCKEKRNKKILSQFTRDNNCELIYCLCRQRIMNVYTIYILYSSCLYRNACMIE